MGLLSAAEDSRPLLLIGMGARGMGPLRAALEWTTVQAHATANPVTLFYIAQDQQSAAYLADWDQWREAGVRPFLSVFSFLCCFSSTTTYCRGASTMQHRFKTGLVIGAGTDR